MPHTAASAQLVSQIISPHSFGLALCEGPIVALFSLGGCSPFLHLPRRLFVDHEALPMPGTSPSISALGCKGEKRFIGWLTLSNPTGPSAATDLVGNPCTCSRCMTKRRGLPHAAATKSKRADTGTDGSFLQRGAVCYCSNFCRSSLWGYFAGNCASIWCQARDIL